MANLVIALAKKDVERRYKETGIIAWDQAIEAFRAKYPNMPVAYVYGSNHETADSIVWEFEKEPGQ